MVASELGHSDFHKSEGIIIDDEKENEGRGEVISAVFVMSV